MTMALASSNESVRYYSILVVNAGSVGDGEFILGCGEENRGWWASEPFSTSSMLHIHVGSAE